MMYPHSLLWQFKISWGFFVLQGVKGRGLCVLWAARDGSQFSLCFYFPTSSHVMNWSIHSQFRSSCPWNHSWSSRSAPSGESLAWTTFLGTGVTWLTSTSPAALAHVIRMWSTLSRVMYGFTCWHAGWNLLWLCPPELQPGWCVPPFYAMTGWPGAPPTPAGHRKHRRAMYSNRDYRFQTAGQGRKVRETFRKPPAGGRTCWF